MDRTGFKLIIVGVLGCIFIVPILAGFSGNGWVGLLYIPFLLAVTIPIWKEIKGILASHNHGVDPDIKATDILKEYAKPRTWLYMIPFYLPLKQTIYNTRIWKLNRKVRTLKQNLKIFKPVVTTKDGRVITITNRWSIALLTILSWVFIFGFLVVQMKINSDISFEVAGLLATVVLITLLTLYFVRRHGKEIVPKKVPKPRITKVGMILVPLIVGGMFASPFTVPAIFGDNNPFDHTTQLEKIGVALFVWGVVGGLVALVMYAKVRKSKGFKPFSWTDAVSNIKIKRANYARHGNPFRMRSNFSDSSYLNKNYFKNDGE